MKMMVKCFSWGIVLILLVMIFSQMTSYNIRQDEMNNLISTAMTSTQIVMKENMEDEIYGTNNKRRIIDSNKKYVEEFATNFHRLATTNSKYTIKIIGVDYKKGFLDVDITCSFRIYNGTTKQFSSRKINIIENLN